jgi:hypothetical protein
MRRIAGEILVTRTVVDVVAGSGLPFADRGPHALLEGDDGLARVCSPRAVVDAVPKLSSTGLAIVRTFPGRTWLRPRSDFSRTSIGLRSDCGPTSVGLRSDFGRSVMQLSRRSVAAQSELSRKSFVSLVSAPQGSGSRIPNSKFSIASIILGRRGHETVTLDLVACGREETLRLALDAVLDKGPPQPAESVDPGTIQVHKIAL